VIMGVVIVGVVIVGVVIVGVGSRELGLTLTTFYFLVFVPPPFSLLPTGTVRAGLSRGARVRSRTASAVVVA